MLSFIIFFAVLIIVLFIIWNLPFLDQPWKNVVMAIVALVFLVLFFQGGLGTLNLRN